jgi:hypothetical protein
MQNLQISYTVPPKSLDKIGVNKLRIYGQINNLFTITKYPGLDPEVRSDTDMTKGIDHGSYGIPRQFIFGVNLSF